ncbi:hypothetical protein ACFP1Z_12395 [Streptomyces gamaensis]|uniref:Uncharacterized protein n=1 Tax=Streptomyces gamaensis TaxID=1763542 RepID=A0ABW0YZN8_9ACTN
MRKNELSTLLGDGQETRRTVHDTIAALQQTVTAGHATLRSSVGEARAEAVRAITGEISTAAGSTVQALRDDVRELRALIEALAASLAHTAPSPSAAGPSPTAAPLVASPGSDTSPADDHSEPPTEEEHEAAPEQPAGPTAPELADLARQLTALTAQLHEAITHGIPEALRNAVDQLVREHRESCDSTAPLRTDSDAPDAAEGELLRAAARIASATVVCHRDTWDFVLAHVAAQPHFRSPEEVTDHHAGRVRADLSGRSLIAVLIALSEVLRRNADAADCALAGTVHHRIAEQLGSLGPGGHPVTIVLDDRAADLPEDGERP